MSIYVLFDNVEETPIIWDITTRSTGEIEAFRAGHGLYINASDGAAVADLGDMLYGVWDEDLSKCVGGILGELVEVDVKRPIHLGQCELIMTGFVP